MKHIPLVLAFLITPAFAQQPTPPSPSERAIGSKLMAEINAGLSCSASLITAQDDIAKLQARVKELEDQLAAKGK